MLSFRRVLLGSLILGLALSACGGGSGTQPSGDLPAGSVQINGAGATFPLPVYTEWTYAYQSVDPSVSINYQGIGSGGGKKAIIDGTVDFAGSIRSLPKTSTQPAKTFKCTRPWPAPRS